MLSIFGARFRSHRIAKTMISCSTLEAENDAVLFPCAPWRGNCRLRIQAQVEVSHKESQILIPLVANEIPPVTRIEL